MGVQYGPRRRLLLHVQTSRWSRPRVSRLHKAALTNGTRVHPPSSHCRYGSLLVQLLQSLKGATELLHDQFFLQLYHLFRAPQVGAGGLAGSWEARRMGRQGGAQRLRITPARAALPTRQNAPTPLIAPRPGVRQHRRARAHLSHPTTRLST